MTKEHDWLAHPRAMVVPLYRELGFDITAGGEGWIEVTLEIGERLLNADGVLHGGVWTLVADSAMGGAVRTMIEPTQRAITAQADFRWLRALRGNRLRAVGRVLRPGRALWHTTVECYDGEDRLVGAGSSTFTVVDRDQGAS